MTLFIIYGVLWLLLVWLTGSVILGTLLAIIATCAVMLILAGTGGLK